MAGVNMPRHGDPRHRSAKLFGKNFVYSAEPAQLIKGQVDPSDAEASYKIDGLSGATITSNGVTYLVQYWLGEDGFGPFIAKNSEVTDATK